MKHKKAFINGKIYTADKNLLWAESVVTYDNKIIFVGSNKDSEKLIDPSTHVIDLNNRLMLPGFIDSHAHILMGGFYLLSVDLLEAKTRQEFTNLLKEHLSRKPDGWVTGGNWNHQNWGGHLPEKEWIDEFSEQTPVFVSRMDYHMALANSYALSLAGITKDTPDPAGGTIVRNPETGEPTGILKDKAMDLIYKIIPPYSESEMKNAVVAAMNEAKKFGVTSIHDITYKNQLTPLQRAEREGYLTARVYSRLPIEIHQQLIDTEIQFNFGSDKLKIGSMKAFADGSIGSSTALFFEPYSDEITNNGLAMDILSDGRLREWMIECDKNKLQLSIHAIGDKAVSDVLDIFEEIVNKNPQWDRRFRLEHAQHIRRDDIIRCKKLGVIVSAQPFHHYYDGEYLESKIGSDRVKESFTFKSFLDEDVRICFGSDWSVVSLNPLSGIYSAVTRQTIDGKYPNGLVPDEKISVSEAVNAYTIDAAYAAFSEKTTGSITEGKLTDLVVLEENIFTLEPEKIKDVKIIMTVFDGEIIYEL